MVGLSGAKIQSQTSKVPFFVLRKRIKIVEITMKYVENDKINEKTSPKRRKRAPPNEVLLKIISTLFSDFTKAINA